MRFVRSSLIVIALIGNAHADGDALVDMLGPREIAVGEAMRGGASGATAITLNPAGLSLNREVVVEGGYGYRPTDRASLIGVSACDSTVPVPGCFFYSYAGASPELSGMRTDRRTHMAGYAASYPVAPRVLIGSALKYYNFKSDAMSEPAASGINVDAGLTLRLTETASAGVAGYNLWGGADSPEFQRAAGGGLYARPIPSLAISFDARWKLEGDKSARYGGGAELFWRFADGQSGLPLRAGALRDNALDATYLSAGIGYASMKFALDIGGRHAVAGSDETVVLASIRYWGPRYPANSVATPGE